MYFFEASYIHVVLISQVNHDFLPRSPITAGGSAKALASSTYSQPVLRSNGGNTEYARDASEVRNKSPGGKKPPLVLVQVTDSESSNATGANHLDSIEIIFFYRISYHLYGKIYRWVEIEDSYSECSSNAAAFPRKRSCKYPRARTDTAETLKFRKYKV